MAEKGHEVVLWRQNTDALKELTETGELFILDYQGERSVTGGLNNSQINLQESLAQAIAGAELVIIPLLATTHLDLAQQTAPYFKDGQVIYLPLGTFGSFVFAQAMKDAGNHGQVAFAETGTLPYLVRKHGLTAFCSERVCDSFTYRCFPQQFI